MNAALWVDILSDVSAAEHHFKAAQRLAEDPALSGADFDGYRAQMALMHALQAGHTSAETALRRIVAVLGEPLPSRPDWDADLMARLARDIPGERPAALPAELAQALQETRRFRHVAMHVCDQFDPARARLAVAAAAIVANDLRASLGAFRAALSP
jgi:hypothetical protein